MWIFRNEEYAGLPTDSLWYNIEVNCDNKNMFGSTTTNFQVMFMLYLIPLIIGILLLTKKKYLLGAFVLSLLANIIFYFDRRSLFYSFYDLKWFVYIIVNIWPILNLALLIALVTKFFQKKYAK